MRPDVQSPNPHWYEKEITEPECTSTHQHIINWMPQMCRVKPAAYGNEARTMRSQGGLNSSKSCCQGLRHAHKVFISPAIPSGYPGTK